MSDATKRGMLAETLAALGLGASALALIVVLGGSAPTPEGPWVDGAAMASALQSAVPETRTLTDAIEYYRDRLESRGLEVFSHRQLTASHLLRFRAYGDEVDLAEAERHVEAAGRAGAAEATQASARSSVHLVRHEFRDALSEARRAVALSKPGDATARWRLFDALWAVGGTEEATRLIDAEHDSMSIARLSREARVLDSRGEVLAARDRFRVIAREAEGLAQPAAVRAWAEVELGHFEFHSGSPDTAVKHFLRALEVLPGSPAALEGLASVAFGADRDMAAAAELYRAALRNGGHLDIIPRLADIQEELGELQEAEQLRADFVLRATADDGSLNWYRRPLAQLLSRDPATVCRAIDFARADLRERQDADAFVTMAWTHYRAGDFDSARPFALNAVESGGLAPPAAWKTALVLHAAGLHREGRSLMSEALEGARELSPAQVREGQALMERKAVLPAPVSCVGG